MEEIVRDFLYPLLNLKKFYHKTWHPSQYFSALIISAEKDVTR
jgi:hypothetical protein